MNKAYKTGIGMAVTAAILSGCTETEIRYVDRVVHLPPTDEQIQKAVNEYLKKMGEEDAELKSILKKMQKDDPTLVATRYDYDDQGNKALILTHSDPNGGTNLTSYAVPIAAGALVAASALEVAEELIEARSKYRIECERRAGYYDKEKDRCENPYRSTYSGYSHYSSSPYYSRGVTYSDYDTYNRDTKKKYRTYQDQKAKKTTAANLSKQLRDKNKELAKQKAKNQSLTTTSKNKNTLSTSKSAFSKKSSTRSSSMSWGG